MSEQNTGATTTTEETKTDTAKEFKAITTQAEFDARIQDRIGREQKKFADYDEVKSKAAQFEALQESRKTDAQKTDERISDLESKLAKSQHEAARAQIQARHSISDDDAALFLTATDPEKLEAQAKALADRVSDRKKKAPVVTAQKGREADSGDDELRETTRQLFKRD